MRDQLHRRIDQGDGGDHREQRERHIASRILELAGRRGDVLETGIGEQQQQCRLAQIAHRRQFPAAKQIDIDVEHADEDEQRQREQLADDQRHAGACGRLHADDVDQGQQAQRAHHDRQASATGRGWRPEPRGRIRQAVAERRGRGDAGQPDHPADLEADERAERFPRIQVAAAGLIEIAGCLRVAQHEQGNREACQQHRPYTGRTQQHRGGGRQQIDAAADDIIDR